MDRPPPYSGYPPGPPPGPPPTQYTTVVPGAVIIQHYQNIGPDPKLTICRSCNQNVLTRIERRPTSRTHVVALILCLFGCWPCVFLPYCMDSCLNTDHYCTHCGAFIGTYIS